MLGISGSTCGTLTIFRPQLHTRCEKIHKLFAEYHSDKQLNFFQKTETKEQTQKLLKNYTCTPCKMLRVPYETTHMKSRLPAEKSTCLGNWTRLFKLSSTGTTRIS